MFKEFESACQESERCQNLSNDSIQRKHCILECVSPICYRELYENDPVRFILISIHLIHRLSMHLIRKIKTLIFLQLEEGEIDVRGNSFKGCFIQRSGLTRN